MSSSSSMKIGKNAFLMAVIILFIMIITAGILTIVIPPGSFERTVTESGREMVVADSYREVESSPMPMWRWFTAPIEVIWGDNSLLIIILLMFMVFMGGSFAVLEQGHVIEHLLGRLTMRFQKQRFLLMALVIFVFMFSGSILGIFEAMLPLIVFVVPLAVVMGWDSLTGLGMSLLAVSFGFSASVTNPFTIGVAQNLAGLPEFSGAWLRVIFFVIVYVAVFAFIYLYARKIERDPSKSLVYKEDAELRKKYSPEKVIAELSKTESPEMKRSLLFFIVCMLLCVVVILTAAAVDAIPNDFAFPVMALLFLVAGIGSGLLLKMPLKWLGATFGGGVLNMVPGIILILMAMSIPHIMTRGGIMDTILYNAGEAIKGRSPYETVFLIYLVTLFMNIFISSASAKAFLMIPVLAPLADLVGITRQTVILAYNFGDGFSNMFYPTNAILLVGLGLTVVGYTKWIRWSIMIQIPIFILSMAFLAFATAIGFGPF